MHPDFPEDVQGFGDALFSTELAPYAISSDKPGSSSVKRHSTADAYRHVKTDNGHPSFVAHRLLVGQKRHSRKGQIFRDDCFTLSMSNACCRLGMGHSEGRRAMTMPYMLVVLKQHLVQLRGLETAFRLFEPDVGEVPEQ